MKRIRTIFFLMIILPGYLMAESARDIIRKVDDNREFSSQKFSMKMIIEKGSQKLVKTFTGYGSNMGDQSFMQFTNPEDRGVKYLKLGDELWIYFPDADDVMKISGHMLRQGMMGSDISYEDMMRREELDKTYEVNLTGTEVIRNTPCHIIEMTAKTKDAMYEKQILYIDKTTFVPLRIEMYAKGGRKLKSMEQFNIVKNGSRYMAKTIVIRDLRKTDSSTTVEVTDIQFNVAIPAEVFTRRNLRR